MKRRADDEEALSDRIVALASRFGRYGYRRSPSLRQEGWSVNHKRVERLWRKERLRVPRKQPKRGRLWLAEGAIVRRPAERPNDVCSYDFVFERTADGRALKHLVVVDEYTRECLAIVVARRLTSIEERACLAERFVRRAVPAHIRSDNGPEFAAKAVPHWLERVGVQTLFIEPGSAWENGYASRLTASSGTSASTVSASTRCSRRRYSSSSGASSTTTSGCTVGSTSSSPVPAAAGGTSPILRSGTTPGGTSGPQAGIPIADQEAW